MATAAACKAACGRAGPQVKPRWSRGRWTELRRGLTRRVGARRGWHLSFGIMAVTLNEFETSSESTVRSEEQASASWERYLEGRSLVLQFLHYDLSFDYLQHHQSKVELLKKCYFYLEIEPKCVNMRDENHVAHCTSILQLIDPCQLQRVKQVGKNQTKIQLSLLTELLELLEQGREELSSYIETCDATTFLSQWDLIMQRLSKLSELMETLLSLEEPGQLYVKHHLVSRVDLRNTELLNIRISLRTKMPLIFDRNESFAHKDWAKLKWFTENQESYLEPCELHMKLLTNGSQTERGYGMVRTVTSDTCVVHNLQPGRSYKFTVRRSDAHVFVFENWHDSMILKTKTNAVEQADSSACAPEGWGDM
ncbi:fibronectin type III domain-containing protein 11 [Strix aluco]|uniref:fibronectin type III domain-containing protein 11 n=1 Tax=Strix aluco TaxID=111821 RepID=UPI003DA20D65